MQAHPTLMKDFLTDVHQVLYLFPCDPYTTLKLSLLPITFPGLLLTILCRMYTHAGSKTVDISRNVHTYGDFEWRALAPGVQ